MKNKLHSISLAFGLTIAITGALSSSVQAGEEISNPVGVVELFTSQGCSSCPPADKALSKLIEEGKVIALSYHVDYWNYLGWKDTLSSEASTTRQYNYADSLKRRGVYTPQAIINGRDHLVGSDYDAIKSRVATFDETEKGLPVPLSISAHGDELNISIGAGTGKANIVAVYFDNENIVDIKRGENNGKKIAYHHSVTDIQTIGMWDGKAQELRLPASLIAKANKGGCAILLQSFTEDGKPSYILGAASYKS